MKKPQIIIDTREVSSTIPDILRLKANVELRQLHVGDYIISERIAIERKRAEDFVESLINKRVFNQMDRLREAYEKPILIIEDQGLFLRNVDSNAIYGALASFLIDTHISIIRTKDCEETAMFLYAIASREQFHNKKEIGIRGKKPNMCLEEWQQFIVEGLPNVSAVLSKRLLDHFGSVKETINASEEKLQEIRGIGKKKAKRIIETLDAKW